MRCLHKKGFSIVTTISILLVVSFIASMMISTSTQNVKQTSRLYLKSQANLLSQSAVEYTLLAISASSECIENINLKFPNTTDYTHEVNVSISYIAKPSSCISAAYSSPTILQESDKTVLLDIIINVNPSLVDENISIHRRSIQKI